ncbi:unnamed protein product [Heligmosomoides polygyrus]|uniref:G protein-coupled receptor n=1 Tax=Heligmosomoides polygyrus TaxID=6339 RepID=A0A183GJ42_HELPZ|nr:unnamed protein product [Heligmosomoides polygyrus]
MIECEDFDLSPQVYLAIMHSLSIIAIPLNVLAVYCIVYKSTRQMGEYKWYLLCYQLTSTLFDFVYMALTLPVIFFPIPMGYPAAWIAQWLSIGSRISVVLVVPLFASLSATILNLFIYRCHLITPPHHILKLSKHGHIYICVTTVVVFFTGASIGILNIATDQEEAKRWVLESILKNKACATFHKNSASLQGALKKVWKEIEEDPLRAAVDAFPERLKACIRVKGGHFEN